MAAKVKFKHILNELKEHAPFTFFGAVLGIVFMLLFKNIGQAGSKVLFVTFHPAHVVLSAMVTTAMFKIHSVRKNLLVMILVGYFGSIGVATLSDVIMPHFGAQLFGLDIPTEAKLHHHIATTDNGSTTVTEEHKRHKIHFGFIEEWYLVNPAAVLGIVIAYFFPRTKFPHAAHILISTWASAAYLLMDMEHQMSLASSANVFLTLFLSVWLPCCTSDIIFPLLFIKPDVTLTGSCPICGRGGHIHTEGEKESSH